MTLTPPPGLLPPTRPDLVMLSFGVSGGQPPYSFAIAGVGLPWGLTLSQDGQLTGGIAQEAVPPGPFACNVTVQFVVTDGARDAVRGVYYLPLRPV